MEEKYDTDNEIFQKERASQNKQLRLKMVKYSTGRNCNEQQKAQYFLNAVALI